ncbi:META domain-containing protein [bacterium]|nr:META domain-containing protein [bacterium]
MTSFLCNNTNGEKMKKLFTTLFLMVTMLVFLSACSTQASLVDTKWQLTSLAGKSPLPDAKITLNFSKDAIGGSDGCNTYGGSYKSVKDTITFGNDIFSTMMYCTDEIAVQYQAYYEMLNQTATYKINDGVLSLMDAKGIVLAEFTASQD